MKKFSVLLAAVLLATPRLFAQQAGAEASGRLQVKPVEPPAAVAPTPAVEPEVTLIPEQVPPPSKPATPATPDAPKEKKSATEQSSEELQERIHFREARIKALRDPKVQAEWDRAGKSRTDLEKREALKSFYTLLYDRIVAIDPTVKKTSDLRRDSSLRRLQQTRIDPTEPLDPQERAERFDRSE
jgi:hypothetical protein